MVLDLPLLPVLTVTITIDLQHFIQDNSTGLNWYQKVGSNLLT